MQPHLLSDIQSAGYKGILNDSPMLHQCIGRGVGLRHWHHHMGNVVLAEIQNRSHGPQSTPQRCSIGRVNSGIKNRQGIPQERTNDQWYVKVASKRIFQVHPPYTKWIVSLIFVVNFRQEFVKPCQRYTLPPPSPSLAVTLAISLTAWVIASSVVQSLTLSSIQFLVYSCPVLRQPRFASQGQVKMLQKQKELKPYRLRIISKWAEFLLPLTQIDHIQFGLVCFFSCWRHVILQGLKVLFQLQLQLFQCGGRNPVCQLSVTLFNFAGLTLGNLLRNTPPDKSQTKTELIIAEKSLIKLQWNYRWASIYIYVINEIERSSKMAPRPIALEEPRCPAYVANLGQKTHS